MDTVQNFSSAFRELRQAAGYKTVAALREGLDARNLRLPTTTVYRLNRGGRPESWERLCLLADFFNISHAKAATDFWNETDGDPCPRGHSCNGVLRLPSEPTAEHLEVELSCTNCGTTKRELISDHHSPRCWTCYTRNSSATPLGQLLKSHGLTVAGFAEEIGRPLRTVTGWVLGKHPPESWEDVLILARHFNMPEIEAAEKFWNQKVDTQCPKHDWCRGRTILPIDDKAQFLDIMIPCQDCGQPKFYRGETRYLHHDQQRCYDCGIKARRKPNKRGPAVLPKDPSRRVWEDCSGYKQYREAKKAIHVDGCPRRVEKPRRRLKFYREGHAFQKCSLAAVSARDRETWIGEFLKGARQAYRDSPDLRKQFTKITGFNPYDDIPRIQSKAELDKQLSACYRLWSYVDEHGKEKVFELARRLKNKPKPTARKYQRRATGDLIPPDKRQVAGSFMGRWQNKELLTCVQGECERCQTLTFSTIPTKIHDYCLVNDIQEPPRGVRSNSLQGLQRHALWAVLQICGVSLTDLESRTGVARRTIIKEIKKIKEKWPEEKRVPKRYQGIVSLLI